MQFIKVSLPLFACVATLVAASPIDLQGKGVQSESSFSKRFNLILADLASLETRDLSSSSKRSPLKANVVIPSVVAVTSAAAIAAASFWSWSKNGGKEAIDGFWESDEGKAFVSKLAGLEKREAGDEEMLKLLGF